MRSLALVAALALCASCSKPAPCDPAICYVSPVDAGPYVSPPVWCFQHCSVLCPGDGVPKCGPDPRCDAYCRPSCASSTAYATCSGVFAGCSSESAGLPVCEPR